MKKLRIIYNYEKKTWELFHQDLFEKIASDRNVYELIITADVIAKLIRPSQLVYVPQNILSEIVINDYND